MARSQPRSIYGISGATPYNRTTGLPYGELRVIKGSSISLQGETVDLYGGSGKYPYASEEGQITSEVTINIGEIPDFIFELFLGKAPTPAGAAAAGTLSTLTNKHGSTVKGATNAITAVSALAGSEANLKFGKYVAKAISASAFALYYLSGIDLGRGSDGTFLSDDMMVASSVTFTSSVATVPSFGLSFAQNGTLAFTVDDTATFEVIPIVGSSSSVRVGSVTGSTFPEYGLLVYGQKRGTGEMCEVDCFRVKSIGMPLPFEMGAFAAFELKGKLLYDEAKDGIFDFRWVYPSTP